MESRDVSQDGNMAEAVVESPAARFFCHRCSLEISPVLPDYTCPRCQGGFIEEVAQPDTNEESDDDGNEDVDGIAQVADLWSMLNFIRPENAASFPTPPDRTYLPDGFLSRPGPSRRSRFSRMQPRRARQDSDTVRSRTEGFLQHLVTSLSENTGLPNASFPVFLNLHSNPGDYAWGRGGWNAIITQLINQLDGTGPPPLPKEKIEEIPTVNICKEQVDKNLQCTVCMEDFIEDEPVRRLACEHHYHENCIIPWLELHGTCPICRKVLNENSSQENVYTHSPVPDVIDVMPGPSQGGSRQPDLSRRNDAYNPHSVYDFTEEFD